MNHPTTDHDEQARFDSALGDPDQLLLESLRVDERRRRRRRLVFFTLLVGGMIMATTCMAVLAGWLTIAAPPPVASGDSPAPLDEDARIEQAETLAAEGWQLWQQQKFDAATARFESAVQLDPEAPNAWNGLGWASFNSGDSESAVTAFEKCVELEPDQPAALNGLGQVYLSWREYDKAEKFLKKAAPQAPAAWFGLSRLYMLTGNYAEARKWIENALQTQPNDPSLQKLLAAAKSKNLPDDLRRLIEPPGKQKDSESAAKRLFQILRNTAIRRAPRYRWRLRSFINKGGFAVVTLS